MLLRADAAALLTGGVRKIPFFLLSRACQRLFKAVYHHSVWGDA